MWTWEGINLVPVECYVYELEAGSGYLRDLGSQDSGAPVWFKQLGQGAEKVARQEESCSVRCESCDVMRQGSCVDFKKGSLGGTEWGKETLCDGTVGMKERTE